MRRPERTHLRAWDQPPPARPPSAQGTGMWAETNKGAGFKVTVLPAQREREPSRPLPKEQGLTCTGVLGFFLNSWTSHQGRVELRRSSGTSGPCVKNYFPEYRLRAALTGERESRGKEIAPNGFERKVHLNLTHSVAEQRVWKIGCVALQLVSGTH